MLALVLVCMLVLITATIYTKEVQSETALDSLVEAERAFAKMSETQGMREAFMKNLASASIVFLPRPTDGRTAYAESSMLPGQLLWQPEFADIALAGDMGYTTGPYECRPEGLEGEAASFGHYVSMWGKDADQVWKILVDIGISHAEVEVALTEVDSPEQQSHESGKTMGVAAAQSELIETDQVFLSVSKAEGFGKAFQCYAADSVRLYRNTSLPFLGKEASRVIVSEKPGILTWKAMGIETSQSGDLGYSYGISELRANASNAEALESYSYFWIWKKDSEGNWKVVLDVAKPLPQPTN